MITILIREAEDEAGALREVINVAGRLGAALAPLHPGGADGAMKRYYVLEVADETAASEILGRLRRSGAVEAAYVKPGDALAR